MRQVQTLFHDGDQYIGAHRDPDLRLDGVLAGAQKRLDAQMLLDPLEEQLDLPSLSIQQRDHFGFQGEIVGQKREPLARFLVPNDDAAQSGGIVLARVEHCQHARLIAKDIGSASIHWMGISTLELGIALGARNEKGVCLMNDKQTSEVQDRKSTRLNSSHRT